MTQASQEPLQAPPHDAIVANGWNYSCKIGCYDHERSIVQHITVDFRAESAWRGLEVASSCQAVVDYNLANKKLRELIETREWFLIETLALEIAKILCKSFPLQRVWVRVTKRPFGLANATSVSAECVRKPQDFL